MTIDELYKLYKKLKRKLCCIPTMVEGSIVLKNITVAQVPDPQNGMIVYVTDTDGVFVSAGFWGYQNGAWVKL